MTPQRNLRRTVLPSGLIVLTERMEHLRSVAMGVWIKSGSRCESAEINLYSRAMVVHSCSLIVLASGNPV